MKIGKPVFLSNPNLPKLTGYLSGLVATLNATNPTTRIDFGVGVAWVTTVVENTGTFTKRLDAVWASGTGNGGLFSGTRAANTWYHCFVLQNSTSGAIDFGFDTSVSGANAPSGWVPRIIWSIKTDGSSNIISFVQQGDTCIWSTPPLDINVTSVSGTGTLYTISVPLGLNCIAQIQAYYSGSVSTYLYFSSPDAANNTAKATSGRINVQANSVAPTNAISLVTNTASQIRVRASSTSGTEILYLTTSDFVHPRGR